MEEVLLNPPFREKGIILLAGLVLFVIFLGIWLEMNYRLFKGAERSEEEL